MFIMTAIWKLKRTIWVGLLDVYKRQDYLLEVQQLRPERKRYKNRRSHLIYGLNRRKQKLEALQRKMKFTCFGGKKLARARTTVYAGQHETWLKAYQSARNRTMMIQGRRQGKFSNNLFQYHIEEGVLIYRCSSEKREIPLKMCIRDSQRPIQAW